MGRLKKTQKAISATVINLDIFRCSVVVIVGPNNETLLKGLPKLFKDYNVKSDITKEEFRECLGREKLYGGVTIQDGVDVLVLLKAENILEVSNETLVHEMLHATNIVCKVHGVDDEETRAYMIEYLCNKFWVAQDEYDEQHPKKSKKKA